MFLSNVQPVINKVIDQNQRYDITLEKNRLEIEVQDEFQEGPVRNVERRRYILEIRDGESIVSEEALVEDTPPYWVLTWARTGSMDVGKAEDILEKVETMVKVITENTQREARKSLPDLVEGEQEKLGDFE